MVTAWIEPIVLVIVIECPQAVFGGAERSP
jgi:hypothetical protein